MREREVMGQCPVALFLALAFSDGAFQNISTPEQLFSLRLPEGQDRLFISWKIDMEDVPIFKQWTTKCSLADSKSFSRSQLELSLAELSIRAGYETPIKPH